jgi:flagellar hook-basal body complex protein FliE
MKINSIAQSLGLDKLQNKQDIQPSGPTFSDVLKQSVNEVNKHQMDGYNAMEGIATGKVENLQQAVQKIEEAELSLKLGLEVKNKALNAYKEIMKMPV